jgi:hypothetical protein
MRIVGDWLIDEDGVARPVVEIRIADVDGTYTPDTFLIDTGADRTVLGASLLQKLRFPTSDSTPGFALQGVGGASPFVLLTTVLQFIRDDGYPIHVSGEVAAFTDPAATDLNLLGRDVLDNFDVIVSWRRNEVLLLAPNHRYRIEYAPDAH